MVRKKYFGKIYVRKVSWNATDEDCELSYVCQLQSFQKCVGYYGVDQLERNHYRLFQKLLASCSLFPEGTSTFDLVCKQLLE